MPETPAPTIIAGGCQCGAVRYRAAGPLRHPHFCHCRMCQRAFGNVFAAFGSVATAGLQWLGERPAEYRSSPIARRGFCRHCGTPLTFQYDARPDRIGLSLGSLDDPAAHPIVGHLGVESRVPWLHLGDGLPATETDLGSLSPPPA
ncbi:MAG: GFA family protein [Thalassobaculales bacterium]